MLKFGTDFHLTRRAAFFRFVSLMGGGMGRHPEQVDPPHTIYLRLLNLLSY